MLARIPTDLLRCFHRGIQERCKMVTTKTKGGIMRYALRNQDKISSVYSAAYLNDHIIKSLDSYFGNTNDDRIIEDISQEGFATKTGEDYPVLRINDISDNNAMLEFVVLRQTYDVLNLAFLGRMKG